MTEGVLTRKACEQQLPEGSDPLTIEIHLAATAADRAESRKQAVLTAARAWLGDREGEDGLLTALLSCEVGGTGGPGGFCREPGTESTARMSWAVGLGKGRRHASDGEAWSSAMRQAGGQADASGSSVTPAHVLAIARMCGEDDIRWPLAYALRGAAAYRYQADFAAPWAACARDIAALCEPDTRAGKLANRYGMDVRRLRRRAVINIIWLDGGGDECDLPTELGAHILAEGSFEDGSGQQLDITSDCFSEEWVATDDTDTRIRVSRNLMDLRLEISSRRTLHPAAMRTIRSLWCMRWRSDTRFADQVMAAHAELSGMHPDVLAQQRARWDIESDEAFAVGSPVDAAGHDAGVGLRRGTVVEVATDTDLPYRVRFDAHYSSEWFEGSELTLAPEFGLPTDSPQ